MPNKTFLQVIVHLAAWIGILIFPVMAFVDGWKVFAGAFILGIIASILDDIRADLIEIKNNSKKQDGTKEM